MLVYVNGQFVPEENAAISVRDRGFLFGEGIYETLRATQGAPFLEDRHYKRFCHSAEVLDFKGVLSHLDWKAMLKGLLDKNATKDALIRVIMTRGRGFPGKLLPDEDVPSTVVAMVIPYPGRPEKFFNEGIEVALSETAVTRGLAPEAKTLDMIGSYLLRRRNTAAFEVLRVNREGFLAEGTVSNLFWIEGNKLMTPSLDTGILPGISRSLVLELAASVGLFQTEVKATPMTLQDATEVFLTSTSVGIIPVRRMNVIPDGGGAQRPVGMMATTKNWPVPGPATKLLAGVFEEFRREWCGDWLRDNS